MNLDKYDIGYYDGMLRNYTETAGTISKIRWNVLRALPCYQTTGLPKTVLDYGSGVGWFRAFKPDWCDLCDTYDVMPVMQTGITRSSYDVVTFWDSMEHIDRSKLPYILQLARIGVAMTLPVKPDGVPIAEWKHFKPGEHMWYPTYSEVVSTMEYYGFSLLAHNTCECPPRYDVHTFLFRRMHEKIDLKKRPVSGGYSSVDNRSKGSACKLPGRVLNGCKDTMPGDLGKQPPHNSAGREGSGNCGNEL